MSEVADTATRSNSIFGLDRWRDWLGDLQGLPATITEAIGTKFVVSLILSHRSQHPEWSPSRRRAIEETLRIIRRHNYALLASPETPLGVYLIQLAQYMRISVVTIVTPETERQKRSTLPWIDRALVALPQKVFVVDVAIGSKSLQLIERRLLDPRFPTGSVFVDHDCGMHQDQVASTFSSKTITRKKLSFSVRDALVNQGAVLHLRRPETRSSMAAPFGRRVDDRVSRREDNNASPSLVPIFPVRFLTNSSASQWPYLTHCTRGRNGAWPDQSPTGYWFSLMEEREAIQADGSPFTTLKRIVEQQRVLATTHLKRSHVPTVSFSEVPLLRLLARRRFRSHLGRWDWEPYGLCVRREWIEKLGGRAVLYQDADAWEALNPSDRLFFQPRTAVNSKTNPTRADSWEEEQEWRLPFDLRLSELPLDAAFHFVPSEKEARELQDFSHFPIVFLDESLLGSMHT